MKSGLEMALEKTAISFETLTSSAPGKFKPSLSSLGNTAMNALKAIPGRGRVAIGVLGGFAIKNMIDKIRNDVNRKILIEQLMSEDPILNKEDPAKILEYYATICMFAPKVAKDKNVVKELLTSFVRFGRVDMQTIESLVKTEKDVGGSGVGSALGSAALSVAHTVGGLVG